MKTIDSIILYLEMHPFSTRFEMAEALGRHPAHVSQVLNELTRRGKIDRVSVGREWSYMLRSPSDAETFGADDTLSDFAIGGR